MPAAEMSYKQLYFLNIKTLKCADPESFVRGGPNLIAFFFLVDDGIEDPNTAIINGPLSARQQNAI